MNIDQLVRNADPAAFITIPDPPHSGAIMVLSRASQRRRRVPALAAGLAAGILVVGGTAYGLTAARGGSGSPAGPATAGSAALTAVNSCPGLAALSGTLEQVNGTSVVIKAFRTGQLVTVTTSASTQFSRQQTGTLSGITDGENVVVLGTRSFSRSGSLRGPLAASMVDVGLVLPPTPLPHGRPRVRMVPAKGPVTRPGVSRTVIAGGPGTGVVTDASPGSFTVIYPGGTRVRVTTSRSTTVLTQVGIGLGQLRTGTFTDAVGHVAAHATLAAGAVEQGNMLPGFTGLVSALGCSSSAIATAMFLPGG
jgi:hypothetical protein